MHLMYLSVANSLGGQLLRDARIPSRTFEADLVVYNVEEVPLNTSAYAHSASTNQFPIHTNCRHFLYLPQVLVLICYHPSMNDDSEKAINRCRRCF